MPLDKVRERSWLERLVLLCCVRIRERHQFVRLVLPSVFTNVANYTTWIMQYLNGAGIPYDKIRGRSGHLACCVMLSYQTNTLAYQTCPAKCLHECFKLYRVDLTVCKRSRNTIRQDQRNIQAWISQEVGILQNKAYKSFFTSTHIKTLACQTCPAKCLHQCLQLS